jgi:hypothetical protein
MYRRLRIRNKSFRMRHMLLLSERPYISSRIFKPAQGTVPSIYCLEPDCKEGNATLKGRGLLSMTLNNLEKKIQQQTENALTYFL